MQEALRDHQNAPRRAIAKNAADLTLKFDGAVAELCAELGGKRPQTFVADLEANFSDAALRGQHLLGTIHAQTSQKFMRSFAKRGVEETMEVEFGKASLARSVLQQNARIVFGGKKIASAAKPAERVVME